MIRRFFKTTDGASAVEFALISPLILVMLIGMIDFGFYIYQKMRLENMAQSTADYLVNGGNDDHVQADVLDAYSAGTSGENVDPENPGMTVIDLEIDLQCECNDGTSVNCSLSEECSAGGDGGYRRRFYSVGVGTDFETIIPYMFIPSEMRIEGNARIQLD